VDAGGSVGFALEAAADWLRSVLEGGSTLYGWAAAHPEALKMRGRGPVFAVPAPAPGPDSRERWVVRHYRRGGWMAPLLEDRYLAAGGAPRPEREARAAASVRARGIPTPAVVAGATYPAGAFYRSDLVTELIPEAADLADILFSPYDGPTPRLDALRASGRLVRRLELAGVHHPDLNAKNIVIARREKNVEAHMVDLDRCRVRVRGVAAPAFPMRRRLARSLSKLERLTRQPLTNADWEALALGWEHRQ
jgi:3-deoxy-D-manno-octulosonic acid kinase